MIKVSVMYPNTPGARFDHDCLPRQAPAAHQAKDGCGLEVLHRRQGADGGKPTRPGHVCRHAPPAVRLSWLRPTKVRMAPHADETIRGTSATTPTRRRSSKSVRWWSRTRPRTRTKRYLDITVAVDSY